MFLLTQTKLRFKVDQQIRDWLFLSVWFKNDFVVESAFQQGNDLVLIWEPQKFL